MIIRFLQRMVRGYLFPPCFLLLGAALLLLVFVYRSPDSQAEEKRTAENIGLLAATNVPDHEVQYEEALSPDWKVNWDLARELYREKKYREALVQYELLLTQKESIDEARWEYATLLIRQKKWQQAGEQIERLMINDPDNLDYRFAKAEVDTNLGKYDSAVELYENLYILTAETPGVIRALDGLIKVLLLREDLQAVLFYLEKLIALKPDNTELQIERARLTLETQQFGKARSLLTELEQVMPENPAVLSLQAELQKKLGDRMAEAGYRQKLISINPDDLDSHTMLYQYYRDTENWTMSLKHLEVLLKKYPNDVDILEAAAEMNVRLERIDRALEYYDIILALQPNNKFVLKKKILAQRKLAEDLVVLVEHNGSQKLWQDLVKVTSDRAGVYRQIALLLKKKGYTDELIEVLTLICLEDPYDEQTLADLTALLRENGRGEELKNLLEKQQINEQQESPENLTE